LQEGTLGIGDRYQQWHQRSFERTVQRQQNFERNADRALIRRAVRRWWWATAAILAGFAFLGILRVVPVDSSFAQVFKVLSTTSFVVGVANGIWGELFFLKARRY
jgi:hypothetical protein